MFQFFWGGSNVGARRFGLYGLGLTPGFLKFSLDSRSIHERGALGILGDFRS